MVKIELKEIVSNHDNRRKALNAVERGNKKTNPQYPYYGANGIVDFIDEYIFDEELLCIAEDGGNWRYKQNCSYIVNGKYWVNNHVHVLKPKKNVEIKYLMYYLNYTDLTSYITGTTRGKLTRTALDKIQINLPELGIQREIVIILDKINNLIEKNKKRIIYLEELVKSRFIEMFEDESKFKKKKLNENVKEMFIGPFGSSLKNECFVSKEEGFCIVYEQKHAIKKTIDTLNRYVDKKKYEELKRFTVYPGDIIVSCRGTVGEIYRIPYNAKFGIMHPSIMKIRLNNEVYNVIFFEKMLEKHMKKILYMSQGSGIKMGITAKELGKKDFIVPPLSLQNEFAEFATKIDKLKFLYNFIRYIFTDLIKKLIKDVLFFLTSLIISANIRLDIELAEKEKKWNIIDVQ